MTPKELQAWLYITGFNIHRTDIPVDVTILKCKNITVYIYHGEEPFVSLHVDGENKAIHRKGIPDMEYECAHCKSLIEKNFDLWTKKN